MTWHICQLLLKIILTIHHVFFPFRLPAPHRSRLSSATPWITTATRRRTLSPPLPPATPHPPGWSPASMASPQSTSTISTATSRTVTACPTVGQASRRASLPLNIHLTTTPQTIHTPVPWKRTIVLRGICRWAQKCVIIRYDWTFSSIVLSFDCKYSFVQALSKAVWLDGPLCISLCALMNAEWMESPIYLYQWPFFTTKIYFRTNNLLLNKNVLNNVHTNHFSFIGWCSIHILKSHKTDTDSVIWTHRCCAPASVSVLLLNQELSQFHQDLVQ